MFSERAEDMPMPKIPGKVQQYPRACQKLGRRFPFFVSDMFVWSNFGMSIAVRITMYSI